MKKMLMLVILCLGISVFAADKDWLTDMTAAIKLSEKTGKLILVDFSGSDWCPYCIMLAKEVFSQQVFKDFAKKKLILVSIDFPRNSFMTDEQKRYNIKLAEKYEIRGFPTVLILDGKGKVLLKTGYREGGAKKYIEFLKENVPAIKNIKIKSVVEKLTM